MVQGGSESVVVQCTIPHSYGTVVVKSPIVVLGVGGISCEGCSPVITLSRPAGDLTMQSYLLSLHPLQCITLDESNVTHCKLIVLHITTFTCFT